MHPSKSHFHDINGIHYHVRTWGDAGRPQLFLLHGWMDVSASFQFLVDCFQRDWHVIAPDWRGFGLSGWGQGSYWFPDYYADLDALVRLYQPETPINLIGHSMGGNIAGTYAGLRPERIAKLVTLEGLGLPRMSADIAPTRYREWLDAQFDPPAFAPYKAFGDLAARLKRNNPRLSNEQADFLARHWGRETDEGGVSLRSDPKHKARNPYLFRVDEAIAIWRCITAPTLLVTGKESHINGWLKDKPEELAERKAAFRNLREVELEDCGHMMHHDQPGRLAPLLEALVADEAPRSGQ